MTVFIVPIVFWLLFWLVKTLYTLMSGSDKYAFISYRRFRKYLASGGNPPKEYWNSHIKTYEKDKYLEFWGMLFGPISLIPFTIWFMKNRKKTRELPPWEKM